MLESARPGCRVLSNPARTRETPRELLPRLPPSRGSSQSALAGTPVPKRPCEHSGPTPGRSPKPVRSVAESPKALRRGALSGSAATPCGVRRERHSEPLPTRRGLPDRSGNKNECRDSPRPSQPLREPGFRASGLLFAGPPARRRPRRYVAATRERDRLPVDAGGAGAGPTGHEKGAQISETPRKLWPKPQPPRGLNPSPQRPFRKRPGVEPLGGSCTPLGFPSSAT